MRLGLGGLCSEVRVGGVSAVRLGLGGLCSEVMVGGGALQ